MTTPTYKVISYCQIYASNSFVYASKSFIYASSWVKTIQAFNALRKTVQIGTNIRPSSARTYVARAFCTSFEKMRPHPTQSSRKKNLRYLLIEYQRTPTRRSETRSLRGLKSLRIQIIQFAQLTRLSPTSTKRSSNSTTRTTAKSIQSSLVQSTIRSLLP